MTPPCPPGRGVGDAPPTGGGADTPGTGSARAWPRPVPVIGDPSTARERAGRPTAWAFPQEERDVLHTVIGARRDIRRFRPDPVPAAVLERVLAAAHAAPSVGHSQPWRFIVVREPATRDRARLLADRERLAQAAQLDDDAARRLLDLQLDGISEAPLGVVVCCDRRTPAAGVLGRATFADTDIWSCACAIQNLWLAARAEGLGVGWVTLFRPEDLARLVHLPDGVVTLGWLCLGWPDERPPYPGLERVGWSERLPLASVVLAERWPPPAAPSPAPPPSRLRGPDQPAVVAARDRSDELLTPQGSLGVLDRAIDRLVVHGIDAPVDGHLVLVGADHPVTTHGVSAYDPGVTRTVLAAAVAGEALGAVTARSCGLGATVVDAGVAGGPVPGALPARPALATGDLVDADALDPSDRDGLIEHGRRIGGDAARDRVVALGEVGVGNTTVAAALAVVLVGLDPAAAVGLGAGADAAMLRHKEHVVGRAVARARRVHGADLDDPLVALAALGGGEVAVLAGVALGAAAAGAVIVLDGLATSVAALLATLLEPAVASHLIAGQRSREAAHGAVLRALGLEPVLDLRLRAGEGVGACLAVGVLRSAVAVRAGTARTR